MSKPGYEDLLKRIKELEGLKEHQQEIEKALTESENRLRTLMDNLDVGIYRSTPGPRGKYIEINPALYKMFGYDSHEEFMAVSPSDIHLNSEDRAVFSDKLLEQGNVHREELKMKKKDGTAIICSTSVMAVKDPEGKVLYFDGIVEDITERKQAEKEWESHINYLESMEQIDTIILKGMDLEKTLNEILEALLEIFQCDRAWLLHPCDPETTTFSVPMECTRPEYPGALATAKEVPNTEDTRKVIEMVLNSAEGPICSDNMSHGPLTDQAEVFDVKSMMLIGIYPKIGKPWLLGLHQCSHKRIWSNDDQFLFNEICHRITDSLSSLLLLRDLRSNEEKFRELFDNISSGVAVYQAVDDGKDFIIQDFNKAGERIENIEKEKLIGKKVTEIFPGVAAFGLLEIFKKVYDSGEPYHQPPAFYNDGRIEGWRENYVYRLTSGEIVAVYDDITEKKENEFKTRKLQEQLFQAQKMESIGRLAGGIAHDFNNILSGIMGFAELLKIKFPDASGPEGKAADVILKGIDRASNLTRQLLGFARGGKHNPGPLDLNELVKETIKISEKIFEKQIDVVLDLSGEKLIVEADKNQLDQVLTNLIINAKDAMPGGGKITIETRGILLDKEKAAAFPDLAPGKYISLKVTDTGIGMAGKIKSHIFEPFFTTKGDGEGTGLGLATVYGIIKNHHGHIDVFSKPGEGASFAIYLPASGKEISKKTFDEKIEKGSATILVVDDEEGVRGSAEMALTNLGYTVLTAEDGLQALEVYKKNTIDLVILDMIMPNMAGKETFLKLKEMDPMVKVILFSGYSQDGNAREILDCGALGFLQKPYKLRDLARMISESLHV